MVPGRRVQVSGVGTLLNASNQQPEPDEQAANQAPLHIIQIMFRPS